MCGLRSLSALLVVGQTLSAVTGLSQPAQPQSAQTASTQSPSSPVLTLLQANANLVLVDAVATEHGKPVHGLGQMQSHVFENGHEQPIAGFDEHVPPNASRPAVQPPALPPDTFSNVPGYPAAGAVNVLLLDALNTPLANQIDVRRQMIQSMGKIEPGTAMAIFTLSSRLRLVEGFTTDAAALAKSLASAKAGVQPSVVLDPESSRDLDTLIGDTATLGGANPLGSLSYEASPLAMLQQFQADLTAFDTDRRVRMTLNAMQQLARYLSAIPGRKNLIWFSGSFPIALDPDDTLDSPFEAMRSYSEDIRGTAELLAASRVAVYPVDAQGLLTPATADASYAPSTNLMGAKTGGRLNRGTAVANKPGYGKDDLNAMKDLMKEQATMQQIAEQTGGHEYLNTNGLKEAVAQAVENGSSYYTLAYVPGPQPLDGLFRKIRVQVDGRDYKLAYRHGYYADPSGASSAHNPGATSLIVAATLHGAPPSTQILFQARVLPAADPRLKGAKLPAGPAGEMAAALKGPVSRYIVDLKVDPRGLAFEGAPYGAQHAKVEFTLVAYGDAGRRVNYLDSGFQVNLRAGQYEAALTNGVPVRLALDLPAGRVFLRIAVHDLNAERAGSLEVPVKVAAPQETLQ